jgi:hypothetical protein
MRKAHRRDAEFAEYLEFLCVLSDSAAYKW